MTFRGSLVPTARTLLLAVIVFALSPAQAQETVSYYKLRVEFSTTSDWSNVHIDSVPIFESLLVSQSDGLASYSVGRDSTSISQPINDALAGQEVSVVFDTAMAPEAFRLPVDLRIEKGHIGRSRVRIHKLLPTGPVLLGEWEHTGVVPDGDVLPNVIYLSVDLGKVLDEAPYQVTTPGDGKMAWAFYFPWYDQADWTARQNLKDVPAQPYDSADGATIARHIDQAKGAGLSGFIVTWQGPGSVSDQALPTILHTADQKDFAISVRFETLDEQGQPRAQAELTQRLILLLNNYGPHSAFMKADGRPVVFLADSGALPIETWMTVLQLVRAQGLDGFFLGESGVQSDLDVLDSLYTDTLTDFTSTTAFFFSVMPRSRYRYLLAEDPRVILYTNTLQPGYDDELLAVPGQAHVVDRQNGATYQSLIEIAGFRDPDWILVNSWNQYYENTHIEPSELYGDQYLLQTTDLIEEWQGPRPVIYEGGVVNSGSYRHNRLATGEIVTIFGEGIGPTEICTMELVDGGRFGSTTLCDTEVTFNGNPSPIVYARSDTVSAVVPLGIVQNHVRVQVSYRGIRSRQVNVPISGVVPGIYTLDSSGSGPAAARRWPDYSIVGPANPASRGDTIMVYMTSGGPTDPPGEDGQIVSQIETLQLPVRAEIGGVPAQVTFAGSAPELIKGAIQMNITVPKDAPTGDGVSLVVWVANVPSQEGVTLAVR